jgi:hypothetical protein
LFEFIWHFAHVPFHFVNHSYNHPLSSLCRLCSSSLYLVYIIVGLVIFGGIIFHSFFIFFGFHIEIYTSEAKFVYWKFWSLVVLELTYS